MLDTEKRFNKYVRVLSDYVDNQNFHMADEQLDKMRKEYEEVKKLEGHSTTFWLVMSAILVVFVGMGWSSHEVLTILLVGLETLSFGVVTYLNNVVDRFLDEIEYWEIKYSERKVVTSKVDNSILQE